MTEHPGHDEMDLPDKHDPSQESASEPGVRPEEPLSVGHEADAAAFEHGHDDAPQHALGLDPEPTAGHEHDGIDGETEEAEREPQERTAAESALAAPGGTIFELVADSDAVWLSTHEDASALASWLEGSHYANAWAVDDGTGAIGALLAHGEVHAESEPLGHVTATIPGHLGTLAYGGTDGLRETATRLWHELAPGSTVPSGPGGRGGEPLSAQELLKELSSRVDDPIARSVVDAALAHARDEAAKS